MSALVDVSYGLVDGSKTTVQAIRQIARHAAGAGASLLYKTSPAAAYVAGAVLADLVSGGIQIKTISVPIEVVKPPHETTSTTKLLLTGAATNLRKSD